MPRAGPSHEDGDHDPQGDGPPKKKRNRKPVTVRIERYRTYRTADTVTHSVSFAAVKPTYYMLMASLGANCRKRKLKCDRNAPCGACKERGEAHLCSWDDAIRPPQQTSARDLEALELRNQLDRLESILGMSKTDPSGDAAGSELQHHTSNAMAFPPSGSVSPNMYDAGVPAMPIPLAMPDLVPSPHSLLPERARLDECMHHFLSRHFAVCPFGHLPTLWNRLLSPMRPGSATRDDWQLAGLLLAICAFSAQSLALGSISSHYSIMESRTMADKAVQALTTGRYMEQPTFDAISALAMLHEYYRCHEPSAAGSYLAIGIQLARAIGLNREQVVARRYSRLDAEVARRLWTLLTNGDAVHIHGRAYSCISLHSDTATPIYLDDSDMIETAIHWRTRQKLELVPVSRLIFGHDLAVVARSITDRAFSIVDPPSFRAIGNLTLDLGQLEASMPPCLTLTWANGSILMDKANGPGDLQRCLAQCDLRREFIRLHRPFLRIGLLDAAYANSRIAAVNNARTILAIHRELSRNHPSLDCWQLTFFSLNAALVVALDLFQNRTGPYSSALTSELNSALDLLGRPAAVLPAASEAFRVLQVLASTELPASMGPRPSMLDNLLKPVSAPGAGSFGGLAGYIGAPYPDQVHAVGGPDTPFARPLPLPLTIEDEGDDVALLGGTDGTLRTLFDPLKPWGSVFWAAPSREEWLDLVGF